MPPPLFFSLTSVCVIFRQRFQLFFINSIRNSYKVLHPKRKYATLNSLNYYSIHDLLRGLFSTTNKATRFLQLNVPIPCYVEIVFPIFLFLRCYNMPFYFLSMKFHKMLFPFLVIHVVTSFKLQSYLQKFTLLGKFSEKQKKQFVEKSLINSCKVFVNVNTAILIIYTTTYCTIFLSQDQDLNDCQGEKRKLDLDIHPDYLSFQYINTFTSEDNNLVFVHCLVIIISCSYKFLVL